MWDYKADDDGDITIDSGGDISIVGSSSDDSDDYQVVLMDIQTGIIVNHLEILKYETEQMRIRAIEDLFRNDDRIKSLIVTELGHGDYEVTFTLNPKGAVTDETND